MVREVELDISRSGKIGRTSFCQRINLFVRILRSSLWMLDGYECCVIIYVAMRHACREWWPTFI